MTGFLMNILIKYDAFIIQMSPVWGDNITQHVRGIRREENGLWVAGLFFLTALQTAAEHMTG